MGYLTTITFFNDSADILRKNPEVVSQGIYDAQIGVQRNRGRDTFPVAYHCNPVKIQQPRHAADHTLYLHAGNTVTDISEIDENSNTWAIDTAVKELQSHLKRLRAIQKAAKQKSNQTL